MRQIKEENEMEKINRKLAWQEFKWSAQETLIKILLMVVLPALLSVATSVVTLAILRKILG